MVSMCDDAVVIIYGTALLVLDGNGFQRYVMSLLGLLVFPYHWLGEVLVSRIVTVTSPGAAR